MKFYLLVSLLSFFLGTFLCIDGTFVEDRPLTQLRESRSAQLSKEIVSLANSHQPSGCDLSPLRIMPLGNSITYGAGVEGGYRISLWNSLLQEDILVDFVGSQANGPSNIDQDHEGHPGKTIQYLRENLNRWLDVFRPDVILLLIGTNDILYPQEHDFVNASYRLNALINQVIVHAPGADLLVASVPPVTDPQANDRVMTFNAEIPAIVDVYVRQGEPVYFVDMAAALTTADLADGIHPNEAGYDKMAQAWYNTLSDLIYQHCQNSPN